MSIQRLHKITTDYEEHIDAKEAGSKTRRSQMKQDDEDNRNGAQNLNVRPIGESRRSYPLARYGPTQEHFPGW
jgi:hypothetical protein